MELSKQVIESLPPERYWLLWLLGVPTGKLVLAPAPK